MEWLLVRTSTKPLPILWLDVKDLGLYERNWLIPPQDFTHWPIKPMGSVAHRAMLFDNFSSNISGFYSPKRRREETITLIAFRRVLLYLIDPYKSPFPPCKKIYPFSRSWRACVAVCYAPNHRGHLKCSLDYLKIREEMALLPYIPPHFCSKLRKIPSHFIQVGAK